MTGAVVIDGSSHDLVRWAQTRRHHHPNVVCLDAPPEANQTLDHLAAALLEGMSKDPSLAASKRYASRLAASWLSLGEVTDVLVTEAQLIDDALLGSLLDWLQGLGVTTWLMVAGTPKALESMAERHTARIELPEHLTDAFPDIELPDSSPVLPPRLPRVDGVVFRSACRTLLAPELYGKVDASFVAFVTDMREELTQTDVHGKTRRFEQMLRRRLSGAPNIELFVLIARAAQVAGIPLGFHVTVDTTLMLAAAATLPRPGLAGPDRWWERFDRYFDPDPGAAAALYTAGADVNDLTELTLADVTDTPGGPLEVSSVEGPLEVTEPGARFVRALVTYRRLCGAGDHERLFATHRAASITAKYASQLLTAPATEVGVAITATRARSQPDAAAWLGRYGIEIAKANYTTGRSPDAHEAAAD